MYTIKEDELKDLLSIKEYCIRKRIFIIRDESFKKWENNELPNLIKSYWI